MKTASCTGREAIETGNAAVPHNRHLDGKIGPVNRENVDSVRGAGSINASARDMANWLRFQLADGVFEGKRLVPANVLKETRKSQMVVRQEGRWLTFFPEKSTRFLSYGMGWFVHDYRGQVAMSHGGTLDGFRAQTMLIPDKKLGIVVFGNLTPSRFPEALSKTLTDMMLGLSDEKWNDFYTKSDAKAEADRRDALKKHEKERKPNTKPSLPLASYTGIYTEPAYGEAEVIAGKDGLSSRRLTWPSSITTTRHLHRHRDRPGRRRDRPEEFETAMFRLSPVGEIVATLPESECAIERGRLRHIIRGGTVYDLFRWPRVRPMWDCVETKSRHWRPEFCRCAKTIIDAMGVAVARLHQHAERSTDSPPPTVAARARFARRHDGDYG